MGIFVLERNLFLSCGLVSGQWGRDLLVAESSWVEIGKNPGTWASMGPRLVSRGKVVSVYLKDRFPISASMGPRLVSRGKVPGLRASTVVA